jgi:asparagine synthase (glutamine-hydrolysing)
MCGIAGFVEGSGRVADCAVLERMTARLAHRGPDGDGLYVEGPIALGHRRLAIIDLAGGAQPMPNEDGAVRITYNGELYNEPPLREELREKGHVYRTTSDTETIVHLYEEEGEEFAARLNGMFALAIWDGRSRTLVLARDRMGQKPLYLADLPGGGLAFASEPKALLEHPDVPRALDPAGLARYLFYEYLPAPHSIWRGVRKLPPAHVLIWRDGRMATRAYWRPPDVGSDLPLSRIDATAASLWSDLRDAVDRHRRADVPIGVFLSGGVDSSSVAAALCEIEPAREVRTFSIGFEDRSFDESDHARAVAAHLGTEHHERIFSAATVYELLPEVAGWLDEPFGDASVLPTHLLSRFAREHVKVVLGGDGADEILAGYPTFGAERAARAFARVPAAGRRLARSAASRLPVDHRNFSLDFKLKQFLRGADAEMPLAHQLWLGSFSGAELDALLVEPPPIDVEREHLDRAHHLLAPTRLAPLEESLRLYQDTYLPEDILYKVDRASMACGLEVRAPLLDAHLAERMIAFPPRYKRGGGQSKRILKRAAAGKLPASILKRGKKGFGIPVARWLRGPLGHLMDELLGADRLKRQGLFRPEAVARLIAQHRAGTHDHRKPLWTLLMFQIWHERWIERN